MKSHHKQSLFTGALLMSVAVGLGAFGAHGLKAHLSPEDLAIFKTGNFYHFIHGIGILLAPVLLHPRERQKLRWVFRLFLFGILVFSGSLYLLASSSLLFGERLNELGMITPLGGISFMAAWLVMASSAFRKHHSEKEKEG